MSNRSRAGGAAPCAWVGVLLLLSPLARANVGPPSTGGRVVAEPVGIRDVAITRETLTIDLRPLADNSRARVEAVYRLNNAGAEKQLDLLFASGSRGVTDFQAWLDEKPIPAAPAPAATTLPSSWRPPKQTPPIRDDRPMSFYSPLENAGTPMAFALAVPPGEHELKVRYAADAGTYHRSEPTVYRQFAYVLAPARSWAGFGGLDVTVHLPTGWRAASDPPLRRDNDMLKGDSLRGSFADLPADAIALTVQAPEGPAYTPAVYGTIGLLGLTCLAGAVLCWWAGVRRGRSIARAAVTHPHAPRGLAWPLAAVLGLAWGLAVVGAGLLATFAPDWVLPDGQADHYGYAQAFYVVGSLLLGAVIVPLGFVITLVTALISRGRQPTAVRA